MTHIYNLLCEGETQLYFGSRGRSGNHLDIKLCVERGCYYCLHVLIAPELDTLCMLARV
jgi:hypothetical protein